MRLNEARKLKIDDRVEIWAGSPDAAAGTVIETGYNAVKIKYDDGVIGVIHLRDMKNVTRR